MKIKIVKDSNRLTGDLSKKTCLVIDVFRATTTIPFLLNNNIKTLFISDGYKKRYYQEMLMQLIFLYCQYAMVASK